MVRSGDLNRYDRRIVGSAYSLSRTPILEGREPGGISGISLSVVGIEREKADQRNESNLRRFGEVSRRAGALMRLPKVAA
jgi:hypothetical protein